MEIRHKSILVIMKKTNNFITLLLKQELELFLGFYSIITEAAVLKQSDILSTEKAVGLPFGHVETQGRLCPSSAIQTEKTGLSSSRGSAPKMGRKQREVVLKSSEIILKQEYRECNSLVV